VDHIKPASWRENVKVKDVSIQTSWICGHCLVEEECGIFINILWELAKTQMSIFLHHLAILYLMFLLLMMTLMKVWSMQHHPYVGPIQMPLQTLAWMMQKCALRLKMHWESCQPLLIVQMHHSARLLKARSSSTES
jgi:hypothetical protein